MQTCETTDIVSMVSPDYILNRFTVLNLLGDGWDGIVIKVLDTETNEVVALKSQLFTEDEDEETQIKEIKMGCSLFPTRPFTHSLIMPQKWAIVTKNVFLDGTNPLLIDWFNKYILDWKYNALKRSRTKISPGLVFTMPLMDSTLKDKYSSLTKDEKRDILFELIITLRALNNMGMRHTDLHNENILLKQTQELRSYTINGIPYVVNSQYMPVIIDFAHVEIADIEMDASEFNDYISVDWLSLRNKFAKDIPGAIRTLLENADSSVLLHEFFHPLQERSVEPESLVRVFAPVE